MKLPEGYAQWSKEELAEKLVRAWDRCDALFDERDDIRKAYAEEVDKCVAAIARAERAEANSKAAEREADRWRHGVPVEGDYVCPRSLEADELRAQVEKAEQASSLLMAVCDRTGAEIDALCARVEKLERERDEFKKLHAGQAALGRETSKAWAQEIEEFRTQVEKLREALEKAAIQTLPPTRAFGCVACRSFAIGRHREDCYVGAALAATEPKENP